MDFVIKKIYFISVLFHTPKEEISRLKREIGELGIGEYEIDFIDNTIDNRGYAAAVNEGIKRGLKKGAEVFVILNPDISLKKLKDKLLFEGLKYFDILGFVLNQNQKKYFGGTIDRWRMSGGLNKEINSKNFLDKEKRFLKTDFVSGSMMIIKKKVIEKLGLFDEKYFLYYEDVDYCYRAKEKGFNVGIDTQIEYDHLENSKNRLQKDYFLFKNRWRFFLKNSNIKQKIREFIRMPKTLTESMPLFKNLIIKSKFLRDFFSLNISSFLNKLIHFLLFLFLVRNLSPSDYGIYSIVWAYLGFFNPFLDLGTTSYGLVYVPKKIDKTLNKLISLRLFISLIIFIMVNFSALLVYKNNFSMVLFIFFVSLTVISSAWSGSYLILNALKQKLINYSLLTLFFNIFFVLLIFLFFLIKKTLMAIFFAVFLSYVIYTVINYLLVKKEVPNWKYQTDFQIWKKIILKSLIFVFIGFFAGIKYRIYIFGLNHFYTTNEVGLFSSSYKFLEAAILIAGSYNLSVMPTYSRYANDFNYLKRKIKKDLYLLLPISLVVVGGFYILAPTLLNLLLTKQYLSSISLSQGLMFTLPFVFVNSVFSNFFYGQDKPDVVLKYLIFQALFVFVFIILLTPKYSIQAPVFLSIISEIFVSILFIFHFKKYLKNVHQC